MAKSRTLDFTNTKERGNYNPKHVEAGDYIATIVSFEDTESKVKEDGTGGDDMWVWGFALEERASFIYPYYCKLVENQLWKIRNVLTAAGKKVPKSKMKVNGESLIGSRVIISLEDDDYDGKPKSVIMAILPITDQDEGVGDPDDDEDDEVPSKPLKKKQKKAAPVIEDDEDEDDDDDDEPAPPVRKKKRKPEPEPEEDDDDEDDDEEEIPVKKPVKKKRKPVVVEEDDDEEDEPPAKSVKKKKRKPVVDEYSEMDVEDL